MKEFKTVFENVNIYKNKERPMFIWVTRRNSEIYLQ